MVLLLERFFVDRGRHLKFKSLLLIKYESKLFHATLHRGCRVVEKCAGEKRPPSVTVWEHIPPATREAGPRQALMTPQSCGLTHPHRFPCGFGGIA